MPRNFLDLCNEVLDIMFYTPANTFDELDTTEGRLVKTKMNNPIVYFLIHNNSNAGTSIIIALKYTSTPVTPPVNATSDIIKISAILILGSKFSKWLCGIV